MSSARVTLDRAVSAVRGGDQMLVGLSAAEEDRGLDFGQAALGVGALRGALAISPSGARFASLEQDPCVLSVIDDGGRRSAEMPDLCGGALEFLDDDELIAFASTNEREKVVAVDIASLSQRTLLDVPRGPRRERDARVQSARMSSSLVAFVLEQRRGAGFSIASVLCRLSISGWSFPTRDTSTHRSVAPWVSSTTSGSSCRPSPARAMATPVWSSTSTRRRARYARAMKRTGLSGLSRSRAN